MTTAPIATASIPARALRNIEQPPEHGPQIHPDAVNFIDSHSKLWHENRRLMGVNDASAIANATLTNQNDYLNCELVRVKAELAEEIHENNQLRVELNVIATLAMEATGNAAGAAKRVAETAVKALETCNQARLRARLEPDGPRPEKRAAIEGAIAEMGRTLVDASGQDAA